MALGPGCQHSSAHKQTDSLDSKADRATVSMTASERSTAGQSLLFPLQFTYADEGPERGNDANTSDQYDAIRELEKIQRVLQGLSPAEEQLACAVQEAKASSILSTGSVDLWAVGSYLRSKHGYLVSLRRSNVSKRPKAYLRQLRHDFLVVRGLDTMEAVDILVDINFRDHFGVAHATPWYSKLLAALPQDWVGSAQALAPLVGLMSAGIRLCFRQAVIPLPPWREGRAMLSKWVTELHDDEPMPFVPLPDQALRRMLAPYHTPFRTAVRQAGEAAAAPAGPTSAQHSQQQQSVQQPEGQQAQCFNPAALPPLPPSTAAVAGKPGQQHGGGADAGQHSAHHHHVPDVPRKIIVGFPVGTAPPQAAALQQQLAFLLDNSPVPGSMAAAAVDAREQRQQQDQERRLLQVAQQGVAAAAAASSKERHGSARNAPSQGSSTAATAAALPARAAGAALAQLDLHTQQHGSANSQNAAGGSTRAPSPAAAVRPAFTATAGVVVATAGGTSPGIVVSKQWVQQLTEGAMAAGGATDSKGKAGSTAAAAGGGGEAGQAVVAANAAAAAARQFKSLDQLLPRMRTVKLGAG